MHICFVTSEYPINDLPHGGVATFIRNLGYKLIEKNIQVSIVLIVSNENNQEMIVDNGINVYFMPRMTILPLKFITNSIYINKTIKKIHKKTPIDFVETPELGLAFISKIKKIKYVVRMNGGHHFFADAENRKTEFTKVIQERLSFKKADYIIAVSEYVAETTRKLLKLGNKEITILYNPIDSQRFYQSDSSKIEPYSIFFAGTIIEKKGIRQLVQSLNYLVDEFPDIKLYIAGRDAVIPGTTISYRPILEKEITDKLRKHIIFLGIIPNFEIPQYIEKSNVCCYPSHMEAMPLAWLEVLAMGKIFIGSNTGPGPEAVKNNNTGLLVNPHEPKEIAEKIKYVFNHHDESISIGNNARKRIIEEFDVTVLADKNINYYNSKMNRQK